MFTLIIWNGSEACFSGEFPTLAACELYALLEWPCRPWQAREVEAHDGN